LKRENGYIFLTFKPGKYGQASASVPNAVKSNTPGRIGKRGVLLNTHMGDGTQEDSWNLKKGLPLSLMIGNDK
jgi:hypothetical protein